MIFPLMVSRLPLFVCDSERMSASFSSGKGQQTMRRRQGRILLWKGRSPPIKSSCFAAYSIGVEPCLFPSSSTPCCPRNEPDILRALNAKKNVSTMKTERSYHPQNRFETKRRLLALPQKIVWIVVCVVALKAIGVSEELTAILMLLVVLYLVHATLRMALRILFFLIRWICIAAALAWIVCRLLL